MHPPFWAPHTSTIDWCEPNYTRSPYIVEWWNTWSNLAYVVLGCYELLVVSSGTRPSQRLAVLLCVIGVSSTAFHGTLQIYAQLLDEIAMNLFATFLHLSLAKPSITIYGVAPHFLYFLLFSVLHSYWKFTTLFQLQFLLHVLHIYHVMYTKHGRAYARDVLSPVALGFACWCVDYLCCSTTGYWGGHACWHVLTAVSGWRAVRVVRCIAPVRRTSRTCRTLGIGGIGK